MIDEHFIKFKDLEREGDTLLKEANSLKMNPRGPLQCKRNNLRKDIEQWKLQLQNWEKKKICVPEDAVGL